VSGPLPDGRRECIVCHSAWPEATFRLSNGALSNVCQPCGLERLAERQRDSRRGKPGPRTQTATVNQRRSPAVSRASAVKVYDTAGNLIRAERPLRGTRLPGRLRT
jgi:hypothetical protein